MGLFFNGRVKRSCLHHGAPLLCVCWCVRVCNVLLLCCFRAPLVAVPPDDHFIPMNECCGIQIRQFPLNEVLFSLKQYYRTVFRMSLEEWVLAYIFWESQCAVPPKNLFPSLWRSGAVGFSFLFIEFFHSCLPVFFLVLCREEVTTWITFH